MAVPRGVAQLKEAAAIVAGLGDARPELGARFNALAATLEDLAGSSLAGSPMVLPLTSPIHRNSVNLLEAGGERFERGLASLEAQVANLKKRAAAGTGRSPAG